MQSLKGINDVGEGSGEFYCLCTSWNPEPRIRIEPMRLKTSLNNFHLLLNSPVLKNSKQYVMQNLQRFSAYILKIKENKEEMKKL